MRRTPNNTVQIGTYNAGGGTPYIDLTGAADTGYQSFQDAAAEGSWVVFTEAPYGVCSASIRDISLIPSISTSAIYQSMLGKGQPSDMQDLTNDGFFFSGHSFVEWA